MQLWCEFSYCLSDHGKQLSVGVMEAGRFKVMVNMSSDHAGIAAELKKLELEIYRVVAHVDDARKLRDYLLEMRLDSASWCEDNGIDMRGWMERTRKPTE